MTKEVASTLPMGHTVRYPTCPTLALSGTRPACGAVILLVPMASWKVVHITSPCLLLRLSGDSRLMVVMARARVGAPTHHISPSDFTPQLSSLTLGLTHPIRWLMVKALLMGSIIHTHPHQACSTQDFPM